MYTWLIWQSKTAPLRERHDAWSEIIKKSPDTPVENGILLSEFLKEYISFQKGLTEELLAEENQAVISYDVLVFDEEYGFHYESDGKVYCSVCECKKDYLVSFKDISISRGVKITKRYFSSYKSCIEAFFSPDMNEIISIRPFFVRENPMYNRFQAVFENMSVNIPVPFKRGDILFIPRKNETGSRFSRSPFIFLNTTKEGSKGAEILYLTPGGILRRKTLKNCAEIDYYTEQLDGDSKVFEYLRQYYSGIFPIEKLLAVYHVLCSSSEVRRMREYCTPELTE